MRFAGKVVVVTGGTRGIGRAVSVAFAEQGALVTANYVRDDASAEETCRLAQVAGKEITVYKSDVGDEKQVNTMFSSIMEKHGQIDVLVNNAAIAPTRSIFELNSRDWNDTLRVNLTGCFLCTKMVLPKMRERRSGKIVNISSLGVRVGSSVGGHYAASKGGMIAFTTTVAREVATYGINVNVVAPGVIRTDLMEEVFLPDELEAARRLVPQGRFGDPSEVAGVVLFLASEAASYINGECIYVAGGR